MFLASVHKLLKRLELQQFLMPQFATSVCMPKKKRELYVYISMQERIYAGPRSDARVDAGRLAGQAQNSNELALDGEIWTLTA
jgi:hypothetical protein